MRAIIAEVSEAVRRGISASNVEEVCRFVVAQVMEDEDRLLFDEEILDIVEPTVKEETVADVDKMIDGDQATLNENEWEQLDDTQKAVDHEGRKYVISGGKIYEANIKQDMSAERIASAISFEIESALDAKSIQDGCHYDFASFHIKADDVERRCPHCGSYNTDAIWYDRKIVISHCHDCMAEFEDEIDPDTATTEELTTEEFDLDDGNSAFIWYDENDGWYLEIDEPDGTCVYCERKSDPDEAEEFISLYNSGKFDIEKGETLKSVESGIELHVSSIDGGFAKVNGKTASISNLKVSKMLGKFISDKSAVRKLIARDGDIYTNRFGDCIVIESAKNDSIVYNEISTNKISGLTQDITARCSKEEFIEVLANNGYVEI